MRLPGYPKPVVANSDYRDCIAPPRLKLRVETRYGVLLSGTGGAVTYDGEYLSARRKTAFRLYDYQPPSNEKAHDVGRFDGQGQKEKASCGGTFAKPRRRVNDRRPHDVFDLLGISVHPIAASSDLQIMRLRPNACILDPRNTEPKQLDVRLKVLLLRSNHMGSRS